MKLEVNKNMDLLIGTHYQNSIVISYSKLVELFGEPILYDVDVPDLDTRAEWIIEWVISWGENIITIIYDWKSNYLELDQVTDWHIGGLDRNAADYLFMYIKEKDKDNVIN